MGAETRDDGSPQRSKPETLGEKSSLRTHEVYDTFNKRPPNANMLPGGALNTAGGRSKELGLVEAAKTVQWGDFKNVHKLPCARDSLLTGIFSAFGLGGIRAILGAPILRITNWAVAGFCLSGWTMYEYCQYTRKKEKDGMKRVAEILDRKKGEKNEKLIAERKAKEVVNESANEEEELKRKKE